MLKGDFTYEFAVFPFDGKWNNEKLHQEALNYNFPLIKTCSKRGNGTLGNQYQPFEMESGNVLLSALYTQNGIPFIRFYESLGSNDVIKLKYQKGQVNYTEADLSGNKQGSVNSPFSFNPWQIRTFRLDVGGK
jgi:alpha-mannosidase